MGIFMERDPRHRYGPTTWRGGAAGLCGMRQAASLGQQGPGSGRAAGGDCSTACRRPGSSRSEARPHRLAICSPATASPDRYLTAGMCRPGVCSGSRAESCGRACGGRVRRNPAWGRVYPQRRPTITLIPHTCSCIGQHQRYAVNGGLVYSHRRFGLAVILFVRVLSRHQ